MPPVGLLAVEVLRMTKIEPANDFAAPGDRVNFDVEQAYRRGVQQGASWACAMIEDGVPHYEVRHWIGNRLFRWRMKIRKQRRKSDNTVLAEPTPAPTPGKIM